MALKLKGSTSGFVGLDAPSVAGNNTLILPENSGSAFQVFANDITAGVTTFTQVTVSRNGDLTVPGTISIGGTLTYEDVTSVDSIGIVTARGLSIFGNTTGLNATGISTFGGHVAINTTSSPTYQLEVHDATDTSIQIKSTNTGSTDDTILRNLIGGTSANNYIYFGDSADSNAGQIRYNHNNDFLAIHTNANERLRITSDGKIGVNITPSTGQFVVKNSDDSNVNVFEVYNDNGNMSGSFSQSSAGDGTVGVRKNDGTLSVFFRSNGVSYVNGGNFGLGTDNPQRLLHLQSTGDALARITSADGSAAYLELGDVSDPDGGKIVYDSGSNLTFYSSSSERLRIDSNGNLSIHSGAYDGGGTTPQLYVRGTSGRQMKIHNSNAGTCSLQITNATTGQGEDAGPQLFTQGGTGDFHILNAFATGDIAFATKPSGGSTTERIRIASDGVVSIGTNDNEPAQLKVVYSTVPTYLTSTFDGTVGEATLSVNVPRTSDGSGSWGSHSNTGYGSAAIQALSHSSSGGYVSILTGSADNTNPTEKLRISSEGYVTKPNHPCFRAGNSATQTPGSSGTIVFNYLTAPTHFNQGGHYDNSTGAFTAPVAGVYSFHCQVLYQGLANGQDMADAIYFYYNSSGGASGGVSLSYDHRRAEYIDNETGQGGYYSAHSTVIVDMAANSSVYVRNNRNLTVHGNANYTFFQGYLIG